MSSRKSGQTGFATKSMFDVLQNDEPEEEEVEEEEVAVDQVIESKDNETSSLSKSARKRLARQTAKAAAAPPILSPGNKDEAMTALTGKIKANGSSLQNSVNSEDIKETAEKTKENVQENVQKGKETAKENLQKGKDIAEENVEKGKQIAEENVQKGKEIAEETTETAKKTAKETMETAKSTAANVKEKVESKAAEVGKAVQENIPESISSTVEAAADKLSSSVSSSESPSPSPATKPVEIKAKNKERSSSPPASSSFSPSLPSSLPSASAKQLPANRKRKQPQDFTPSGPGTPSATPASPKNGVKFSDGVAPGEGPEGEKIIPVKKNQNVIERTVWTFIMIFGFIGLLCAGHPYMILLVMLCQALVYSEVTALFNLRDHGAQVAGPEDEKDNWSKSLNWYFFAVANYFLYGESIIYYFKHIVFVDAYFIPFARNHRFISFMLYTVGFVGFVANLKKAHLRQQFALFCWVHISLFLIVVSSHFIVNSILEGMIWFFVPASLVICNDVMAYVCGKMFGRTPLIKLSPKKTVEGFMGAFLCTLLFSLAWGTFFMRFNYMICPARDLGANAFSNVTCKPNPVFVWRELPIAAPIQHLIENTLGLSTPTLHYAPFQIHCLVMATFASLVAPFGGFFASGFKRAFNIKDFGHSIPGHGGMTDRMDCQFMMGIFAYTYYSSLIRIQNVSPGSILQTVVTSLTLEEQMELLGDLKKFLTGQGVRV